LCIGYLLDIDWLIQTEGSISDASYVSINANKSLQDAY
jgi:hypothetical protein